MNTIVSFIYKIASKTPMIGDKFTEEFIRFVIIGGTSFVIFYTLNNSFVFGLDSLIDPETDHTRAAIVAGSYLSAYMIAFLFNFSLSRSWTFKSKGANYKKQAVKFFAVNTFNALAGAAFVTVLDYAGIPPFISQPFFIGMQTIWTFILYKKWVFQN